MKRAIFIVTGGLTFSSCQSDTPPVAPVAAPAPRVTVPAIAKAETKVKPAPLVQKSEPQKPKPYPLDKCLVSDEPLDEWDDMQTVVYQGQEMKFCCKMCLGKFKKDPQKYLDKL